MARKTKRIFAFGRSTPQEEHALDAEAFELTRKVSVPETQSGRPQPSERAAGQTHKSAAQRPSVAERPPETRRGGSRSPSLVDEDEDDATLAVPLVTAAAETRGARLGPGGSGPGAGAQGGAPRPAHGSPDSGATNTAPSSAPSSDAMQSRRRLGPGETIRMGPDPHGPTVRVDPSELPGPASEPPTSVARGGARSCPSCGLAFSSKEIQFCPYDGERLVAAPAWDPRSDPLLGRTIGGRYEVQSVIAEGSMGTVYRVRHARLGTSFALKILRRELARDSDVAGRLVDEARATAAIGHPNIVAVTDFGEIGADEIPDLGELRLPYFVMELISGGSLAELIAQGPLDPGRVAHIAQQCAQALSAAHAAGIIHRDLKPGNIRLVTSAKGETVKILDFGVAKILGSSRRTKAGMVFGTPHYMSPEQGRGHPIDHRTDIYSLGVIMYQCLSGRVPFEADTYMGVVTKHLFARAEPIVLDRKAERGARGLDLIVMRCLEKDPAHRYASMSALSDDLEAALAGRVSSAESAFGAGGRLVLRDQELLATGARDGVLGDAPPRARAPLHWIAASAVALGLLALAWWRPWLGSEPAAGSPSAGTPSPGRAAAVGAAPLASAEPRTSASGGAAPAPSSGGGGQGNAVTGSDLEQTTAAPTGVLRPARRSSGQPSGAASSSTDALPAAATAAVTASGEAAATTARPPPAKPPPSRGHGDVVDPWAH